MIKIFFDMDGVLADFDAAALKVRPEGSVNAPMESMAPDARESKREFWRMVQKIPEFWISLPEIPGARVMVAAASGLGELHVLSGMPKPDSFHGGDEYVEFIKREKTAWLGLHFDGLFAPENIILTFENKGKFVDEGAACILVDDRARNVADWTAAGGIGIVFNNAEQASAELEEACRNRS
ncbi:MAG: hypothetical protein LBI17_00140, partial [Rickettsiales bacterium]|nr:hypothetical protein [Rickettsiales bacterium]